MPNQLTRLPPNKKWVDIHAEAQKLPQFAPRVDLSSRLNLKQREEHIFVAATWSGKSELLRQLGLQHATPFPTGPSQERVYGVYDDSGQDDDQGIVRTVTAMLKFHRTQKLLAPLYKPIVLLRNSTWHRIKGYFTFVPRERVGQLSFPTECYYDMLRAAGMPEWLLEGYLGPQWIESLQDAHGHLLPKLAWDATLELINQTALTSAKPQAVAAAAVSYIRQCPTLQPFLPHLTFVVPDDYRVSLRGRPLQLGAMRLDKRLLTAMSDLPLPDSMTRPEYIDACKAEGILRRRPQLAYIFAKPFAQGLVLRKRYLTLGNNSW